MSDKKLPKYSWLNFTEKQQIKQFMRIAGLDTFEINVQNSQIFEKIFRINSLSEQISEAEESDRFLSTAHDADEEITNSEEMFVLEEIQNFDAINSGFSGLEIRNKKKTKQTSITSFFKNETKLPAVFDLCNINYVIHKTFFIYQRI